LRKRFDNKMQTWPADRADLPPYATGLRTYLVDQRDDILVGDSDRLRAIVHEIEAEYAVLTDYLRTRGGLEDEERDGAAERLVVTLKELFNYQTFSTKHKGWDAYKLVGAYKLRLCPYCQLHHVNYHAGSNPDDLELRPPLDHYLPRSVYPYLAVSIGNLVPSCHQCNSSIKGDRVPDPTMPHPMSVAPLLDVSFKTILTRTGSRAISGDDVKVELAAAGGSAAFAGFFRLQERYQWYADEIADMYERLEQWHAMSGGIADLPLAIPYALGFEVKHVDKRAVGRCLLELARRGLPTPI
jgi:hypothetical protein